MNTLIEKIAIIQQKLNAPKDALNDFGKYYYRSAESILAALKPLLAETGLVLTISDSIEAVAERVYIRATARISNGSDSIETTAYAREPLLKKGSDESQITGAASSYARKYALCGLFAIDDNRDADAYDNRDEGQTAKHPPEPETKIDDLPAALNELEQAESLEQLKAVFSRLWKQASAKQKAVVKEKYDSRKADHEAAAG